MADLRGVSENLTVHKAVSASHDPDCPDIDKGKMFAVCNRNIRVYPKSRPGTYGNRCKRCFR